MSDTNASAAFETKSLSARLKTETRQAHEEVEAAFDFSAATATLAGYLNALQRTRAAHGCVLESLHESTAPHRHRLEAEVQMRHGRLDDDLQHFGATPQPGYRHRLALNDDFALLGCEYVQRGSALGGLVILKQLRTNMGPMAAGGTRYFLGDGPRTAEEFALFRQRLDEIDADEPNISAIIASANATFQMFRAVFSESTFNPDQFCVQPPV